MRADRGMTPTELGEAIRHLFGDEPQGTRRFAAAIYVQSRSVRMWRSGEHAIPGPVTAAASLMLELGDRAQAPMTRAELRQAILELYDDPLITQRQYRLARAIAVSHHTLISWLYGGRPIPGSAEAAIRLLLKKKHLENSKEGLDR